MENNKDGVDIGIDDIATIRRCLLFVRADASLDDRQNEATNLDTSITSNQITSNEIDYGDAVPIDESYSLTASLAKAVNVGAQIREAGTTTSLDGLSPEPAAVNVSDSKNSEDQSINAMATNRCHWGKKGCKRGQATISTSGESSSADTSSPVTQEDEDNAKSPERSSSSFAGSATAKIKARIKRGGGSNRRQSVPTNAPVWKSNDDTKFDQYSGRGSVQKPPHGFKLAGRVVTSPSDGLSYFLDSPQVTSEDEAGNSDDLMMTIPYVYLECGPTIESTTEAFPLTDMVLRHFPASASMGHWVNLGGGITLENDSMTEEGEGGDGEYIDTNGKHEGQPKLLIALSPIEITVSGNDEESRIFNAGDVILMEDTLGKGHKMNAAPSLRDGDDHISKTIDSSRGQDMIVLMVSLPHTVHFPFYDWLDESSDAVQHENHDMMESVSTQPASNMKGRALSGFAPKHLHHNHQRQRHKQSSNGSRTKKPCPIEYDSAYSSLFMPTHHHIHQYRRSWRTRGREHGKKSTSLSAFDSTKYPPPPGFSTYDQESLLMEYLPSLRRTMLVGLGLSLTSSFIYCAQLLYPPVLALWGGATVIFGGAIVNVLLTRWSYRRFIADWEEEWRWKREVAKNRLQRETMVLTRQQQQQEESGDDSDSTKDVESEEAL